MLTADRPLEAPGSLLHALTWRDATAFTPKERLIAMAGLPRTLHGKRWENFIPPSRATLDQLRDAVAGESHAYLYGPHNSGKSHCIAALVTERARANKRCLVLHEATFYTFSQQTREWDNPERPNMENFIDTLTHSQIDTLIFDGLGIMAGQATGTAVFYGDVYRVLYAALNADTPLRLVLASTYEITALMPVVGGALSALIVGTFSGAGIPQTEIDPVAGFPQTHVPVLPCPCPDHRETRQARADLYQAKYPALSYSERTALETRGIVPAHGPNALPDSVPSWALVDPFIDVPQLPARNHALDLREGSAPIGQLPGTVAPRAIVTALDAPYRPGYCRDKNIPVAECMKRPLHQVPELSAMHCETYHPAQEKSA